MLQQKFKVLCLTHNPSFSQRIEDTLDTIRLRQYLISSERQPDNPIDVHLLDLSPGSDPMHFTELLQTKNRSPVIAIVSPQFQTVIPESLRQSIHEFVSSEILTPDFLDRIILYWVEHFHYENKINEFSKNISSFLVNDIDLKKHPSSLAHEINNPLAVLYGYAEKVKRLLGNSTLPEVTNECQDICNRMVETIKKINQIVKNFSRSQKDIKNDQLKSISSLQIIEDGLDLCRSKLQAKDVSITITNPKNPTIKCNPVTFAQVISNIAANAAEAFTHEANCKILIEVTEASDSVNIAIENNGPSISEEIADQIFKPLFTTKKKEHNIGLGLSLSRQLTEQQGGLLSLVSSHPVRFLIRIPKNLEKETKPKENRNILLVDDNEEFLHILSGNFSRVKVDYDLATTGQMALKKAREKHFDVILCDLNLPDMDGLDIYRQLNSENRHGKSNFFFMTGYSNIDFGAEENFIKKRLLHKPFDSQHLL